MHPKRVEEIRTSEELTNYMEGYGYHINFCLFDYYSITKSYGSTYVINFYKEKHRPNWYNDSIIKGKNIFCNTEECVEFIKNEVRRAKLKKLQSNFNKIEI